MKSLTDHLSQYADYHRDPRNIATHLVGVPMILVAVVMLLSRPAVSVLGVTISPAAVLAVVTALYYLRLDLRYGLAMGAVLLLSVLIGQHLAAGSTEAWLSWGIGLFVVGWIIQFVGHVFEGRKPAFVDDLMGLIIGPLFVAAEVGYALGLRHEVKAAVEARSGPLRRRSSGVVPH